VQLHTQLWQTSCATVHKGCQLKLLWIVLRLTNSVFFVELLTVMSSPLHHLISFFASFLVLNRQPSGVEENSLGAEDFAELLNKQTQPTRRPPFPVMLL